MEEDRVTVYFTKREVSPVVDKVWLFISQMESRVSLMEDSVFISQMQNGEILWSFHQRNKKWEEEEDDDDQEDKEWTLCMSDLW